MNQVAKKEPETTALASASETGAIISMIERAARDPAVDIDKMQRLISMRREMLADEAKRAYAAALADMQPKLPIIPERGKIKVDGKVRSTYALWEDINELIKPILAEHGFAISFRTGRDGDQRVVTGILLHRQGHSEETTMHLPLDTSGSKNNVQSVGSSTSYGKRYTAQALLNLTSRGEDDDGVAAGAGGSITEEQIAAIQKLIVEVAADIPKFCKYMNVEKVEDIPSNKYQRAVDALEAKRVKK